MDPNDTCSDSRLGRAFVEDHKHMIGGFAKLKRALEQGAAAEAKQIADDLDRLAGPHIQFEEEVLYPRVAEARGRSYAERLYEEHADGKQAIRTLRERSPSELTEPETRAQLISGVQTVLDHAISCGTLLSHLTSLPADSQQELLARLESIRREGTRWTELHDPNHPPTSG